VLRREVCPRSQRRLRHHRAAALAGLRVASPLSRRLPLIKTGE
jgi:hypothetical protein